MAVRSGGSGFRRGRTTATIEERIVYFRPRAILVVLGIILSATAIIAFLFLAWHVITWILIALFLAIALNPAVEFLVRRGLRRSLASVLVFVGALATFAGARGARDPAARREVNDFVDAVPGYVDDLTSGRGPLGFLERDYQIVDKVRRRSRRAVPAACSASRTPALASRRASSPPSSGSSRSPS